jgi:hypothetical protein
VNDISRSHAALDVLGEGAFHITDLKSKNGTTVNGRKVESARFRCGDHVCLSSAELVVDSSESSQDSGEKADVRGSGGSGGSSDETEQYSREATVEDMVTLLERVASSGAGKSVWSILQWSVERFSMLGAIVLRVSDGAIAVEGNAGATGDLVRDPSLLRAIAAEQHRPSSELTVRECTAGDSDFLVASLDSKHLLLLLLSTGSIAFHDLRAICAALRVSLTLARSSPSAVASRSTLDLSELAELPLKEATARFERALLQRHLQATDWNQSEVARRLKISRTALFRKVRKHGLQS